MCIGATRALLINKATLYHHQHHHHIRTKMPKVPSTVSKNNKQQLLAPAPKDWQKMYSAIAKMRSVLFAPVDVIGCHMLADRSASKETQRFQTLLALMLSAQTRDQCTAGAMKNLINNIKGGCTAESIAKASEADIKKAIASVCFYNNKAGYIRESAKKIVAEHGGVVPHKLADLLGLPGVGKKMAHIFKECADDEITGIGVDTHMHRNFRKWKWADPKKCAAPDDTMRAIQGWLPLPYWKHVNEIMVGFGQTICGARAPMCESCLARHWCPGSEVSRTQKAEDQKTLSNPKAFALQEIEDLAKMTEATAAYRDKVGGEYGMPPVEREWVVPQHSDGMKPQTIKSTWLGNGKLKQK